MQKQRCARAAYEGLMQFVNHQLRSVRQSIRHLRHVHFVNIDKDTTDAMANVMKSLYENKHMFPSQLVDRESDERGQIGPGGVMQIGYADTSTNTDSVGSGMPRQEAAASSAVHLAPGWLKPAVESGKHVDADANNVMESNKTQQSSSEISPQNGSFSTDIDVNQAVRDVTVSADIVSSSTEERASSDEKCDICHSKKPVSRQLACAHFACQDCVNAGNRCSRCKPFVMVGRDGENLSSVDGVSGATTTTTTTTAAATSAETDGGGSKQEETSPKRTRSRALKNDDCVVCLEQMTDPKQLDCGHKFCRHCIDEYFQKGQPKYPSCGKVFGNAAESIVTAAVNKICDGKSSPAAVSDDDTKRDVFSFHIPLVRLTVHVRQGIQRSL